jgi:hypothetical protein
MQVWLIRRLHNSGGGVLPCGAGFGRKGGRDLGGDENRDIKFTAFQKILK